MATAAQSTEPAGPILRLRGLGRRFGGLQAVADVDLEVRPGERRAILGPNGAGKTTLFNLITGEFPPTEGAIELFGYDVTREPERYRARSGLARTFQSSRLFFGLTVEDNLYLSALGVRRGHLRPVRLRRDGELRARAREIADTVGLGHRLNTLVSELGHGEQRQLELGIARAAAPRLMLLDEPAAGLSFSERQTLIKLLEELDPDVTLILIEHDMMIALSVARWVTMMDRGRIVAEGTPQEIRDNPEVQRLYLGKGFTT